MKDLTLFDLYIISDALAREHSLTTEYLREARSRGMDDANLAYSIRWRRQTKRLLEQARELATEKEKEAS